MIKRVVIILSILALSALVMVICLIRFIDPNYFKSLITETVRNRTGYELTIAGDLRWHVWPQISLLTEAIRLEDKGAKEPIFSAENMRLDVNLLPLFTKKLVVNSIFVKSAVINITADSRGKHYRQRFKQTKGSLLPTQQASASDWSYSLRRFEIDNSTFILQISDKEYVHFRHVNLLAYPGQRGSIIIDLNGSVNRNQRILRYDISAAANVANFPDHIGVKLNKFDYLIRGVGLPVNGLFGTITANVDYHNQPLTVKTQDLIVASANNKISGRLCYMMDGSKPFVAVQLFSQRLDLAPYINQRGSKKSVPPQPLSPMVLSPIAKNELAFLNDFDANIAVQIDKVVSNQLQATDFVFKLINNRGKAQLEQLSFGVAGGSIAVTGQADGRSSKTAIRLNMQLSNLALNDLLTQLSVTDNFDGQMSGDATFTIDSLAKSRRLLNLKGGLNLRVERIRLNYVDLQQIIDTAAAQFIKEMPSVRQRRGYTIFNQLSVKGKVDNGQLNLTSLMAVSDIMRAKGGGNVNLLTKDLDIALDINVLNRLDSRRPVADTLKEITIPLKVYGPFAQLHYQVDMDKLLQRSFKKRWQEGVNKLKNKYLL